MKIEFFHFEVETCCPLYRLCLGRNKKPSFRVLTFYLLTAQQNPHFLQHLLNITHRTVNGIPCRVCCLAHLCVFCGTGAERMGSY